MEENNDRIVQVDIKDEMKKSYIDYAMSVIIGRALPDVRDGLKPVHRRILYSMSELGLTADKQFRKSARIVGDVLGKYHPHGDTAVYDAMVRLAQPFSTRYLLVDGHGNFGSVDGDSAAAMRYTEAKMTKIAFEMLKEIEKETVDFIPNFDDTLKEPSVLPSRYPNLLVNGSQGIAVGMATNIPPHNLGEVIDGVVMMIDNPETTVQELMTKIKGPDFPTAGIIMGTEGIKSAYETGRGKIKVRAKAEIEEMGGGKSRIVVNEIPYLVNKSRLIEKIAELVRDKKIEGISDLRDESDRDGMRIVVEVKRDVNANVILNQLFKHTQMEDTFGVIMIAIVDGQPQTLNLKEIITHYLNFQKEVIIRRTRFDLNKAEARAHILEGLKIALDHIDEVIKVIRSSKTVGDAKQGLTDRFGLSDIQSQSIIDMRLARLTGLEREKIEEEYAELIKIINYLRELLANERMVYQTIRDEILITKKKYSDGRRTKIMNKVEDIDIADLIPESEVVLTLTHFGYVKRLGIDTYTAQKRGGKGIAGLSTREDDFVEHLFITSTHNNILFFTIQGRVYTMKAFEIPEASRQAKGTAIVNLLQLNTKEKIQAVMYVKEFEDDKYLVMTTRDGIIKKSSLKQFSAIRKSGLIAINLRQGDELIDVKLTNGEQQLMIVTSNGYSIRFSEQDVRSMGRGASGVKAITLREGDIAVGMDIVDDNSELLTVSEKGFGKRTRMKAYGVQGRGGKGVKTYKVTDKTGKLVGAKVVTDKDQILLINNHGTVIRLNVANVAATGRNTLGVTLMKAHDDVKVVSIAKINSEDIVEDNIE